MQLFAIFRNKYHDLLFQNEQQDHEIESKKYKMH